MQTDLRRFLRAVAAVIVFTLLMRLAHVTLDNRDVAGAVIGGLVYIYWPTIRRGL